MPRRRTKATRTTSIMDPSSIESTNVTWYPRSQKKNDWCKSKFGLCITGRRIARTNGEKSHADGCKESRINRFTRYPANVQKFTECDVATTFGTTNSFDIRISPYDGSYRDKNKFIIPEISHWQLNL